MNSQRGKITVLSLVMFVILAFAVFVAFKYVGTNLAKKQIKKEVFDTLGNTRGGDMGNAEITAVIEGILKKKGVEVLRVSANISASQVIDYSFQYRIRTDYILFKRSEVVTVSSRIENYG